MVKKVILFGVCAVASFIVGAWPFGLLFIGICVFIILCPPKPSQDPIDKAARSLSSSLRWKSKDERRREKEAMDKIDSEFEFDYDNEEE